MQRGWVGSRLAVVAGVVVLVTLAGAGRPVHAHTELESSTPAAGETVAAAVSEITLVWTGPVSPVEDGFEVLDPNGQVRPPTAVAAPSGDTLVLQFDPPLAGGAVGVRWAVAAADGHVIEGTFSFTVDAPAPTTTASTTSTPTTSTTTTPTTVAPSTTAAAAATPPAATTTASPSPAAPATTAAPAPTTTTPPVSLDDFLGQSSSREAELRWRRVGQVIGVAAVVLGVGLLAFVALVVRRLQEIDVVLLRASAVAGLVAAFASVLEAAAHAGAVTGRGLGVLTDVHAVFDALGGTYAAALLLRLLGGGVLAVGAAAASARLSRPAAALAAGAAATPVRPARPVAAAVAVAGAGALVVSYAFDGHTVSKGNRFVQTVADVVHVSAASIWVGGAVALTWLAWRRWRRGGPRAVADDAFVPMALRWSTVAGWALLAVALAGVAMALSIIDGVGDLTGTAWGKILLFKLAGTTVAVALAAYNRFALLPALERTPDDPTLRERVTDALAAEAFILLVVAVLAGLLMSAVV